MNLDIRTLKDKTTVQYRFLRNGQPEEWKFGLLRVRTRKLNLPARFRGMGDIFWQAGDPSMLWIENEPDAEFVPEEFQNGLFKSGTVVCEINPGCRDLLSLLS